jgi:hypothetical protein
METHKCLNPDCGNETKNPKYCSRSCAAKINNAATPKRIAQSNGICEKCGITIFYKKQKRGGYSPRRFCETCFLRIRAEITAERHNSLPIEDATLAQLKQQKRGYWSWRVSITRDSRNKYLRSNLPKHCCICGYNKHFDVCHRKDISTYADEVTIREINILDNLIALCRNHHWEFDKSLLSPEDRLKLDASVAQRQSTRLLTEGSKGQHLPGVPTTNLLNK